jgi:TolB protein
VSGPDWSPDGTKILISSPQYSNISIYDIRDGEVRVVTRPTGKIAETYSPKWSVDGARIAFSATLEGEGPDDYTSDQAIVTMDLNGGHLRYVPHTRDLLGFDWSPVDDRIVFASGLATRGGDCNGNIFVTTPTGRPPTRVVALPCREFGPAWSPDGNAIAFVEQSGDASGLYVADSDGSKPRLIVPSRAYGISFSPAWQPPYQPSATGK